MYVLTKMVGTNYCIFDSSDNSIEWLDKDVVLNTIRSNGITVKGIQGTDKINHKCCNVVIPVQAANWGTNRENIFGKGSNITYNKQGVFQIICGKKKFKGLVQDCGNVLLYHFNNGVTVEVPR